MKTRSRISILSFVVAFIFLTACSGGEKHEHDANTMNDDGHASGSDAPQKASTPQFQVDQKFQEQLAGMFASYIEIKDALVASDAGKVKSEASQAKESLAKVDMKLLSGAAHNDWMNWVKPIENSLTEIETASDIEEQRKSFSTLSDNVYKSVKAFGLGGSEAFYEYCPMAFNNEGAYWLSDNDQVRNPYFGDKMLKCGVVKERLR
jgi:Cu(I)/Ag(I) efflux system membrane fusion protein